MNNCTSKWYYNAVLVYGAIYQLHSVQKSRMSGPSQRECKVHFAFVINQLHVRHCACITSYDEGVSKSTRLVAEVLHNMVTCLEAKQCVPTCSP